MDRDAGNTAAVFAMWFKQSYRDLLKSSSKTNVSVVSYLLTLLLGVIKDN